MNKAELIAKIAEDAGITKTQANATIDSFVEAVTKSLKKGDKVTLVGFGTFSVTKRAARNGRNPQTGATIKIKAKKVARFKPGTEFRVRSVQQDKYSSAYYHRGLWSKGWSIRQEPRNDGGDFRRGLSNS